MSKIRFEWDIESQHIDRSDGEDPLAKRRRRRNVLRLLLLLALLLAMIALGGLILRQRLIDVENQFAQLLQDTVKAEVAALRIGDLNSWIASQAPENESWIGQQRVMFQHYSDLKSAGVIELSGDILAVHIDGERARVLVQENVNNLPYSRLWFYRRAGSSWLHTAPDHSFWGEKLQFDGVRVRVNYREVDRRFAKDLGMTLEGWRQRACAVFDCSDLPLLIADVALDSDTAVAWADEPNLRLEIRSPHLGLARADAPFDRVYQHQASQLFAERIVNAQTNYQVAAYPHDAFYLRQAAADWLTNSLTGTVQNDTLIGSLADNYGAEAVAQLLANLGATDSMAILQQVTPDPLEAASLDWRDLIGWRLALESKLIGTRAEEEWLRLYDTSDESVRRAAYQRYNQNAPPQAYKVLDQFMWTSDAGNPQLRVTVETGDRTQPQEEIILFNLVNDVWKRSS